MTPTPRQALSTLGYCPHNGGHPVRAERLITIPLPAHAIGAGLPLYLGCDDCLTCAVERLDAPPRTSLEPILKGLLIRACHALTTPMTYAEVGELVSRIQAVIALAD